MQIAVFISKIYFQLKKIKILSALSGYWIKIDLDTRKAFNCGIVLALNLNIIYCCKFWTNGRYF